MNYYSKENFTNENISTIIIKPHINYRNNLSIISDIINAKFEILNIYRIKIKRKTWEQIYENIINESFFHTYINTIKNKLITMIILKHKNENTINKIREIIGNTDPKIAKNNTIRYIYGINTNFNAVHAPDNLLNCIKEYNLIYKDVNKI